MEAVLKTLFWKKEDKTQMGLFDDDPTVVEVHRKWDRAAEREKKSRTLFAQHGIKPNEVAEELETSDLILGSPDVVERFLLAAMQRINCPMSKSNGYWNIEFSRLPDLFKAKLTDITTKNLTFEPPDKENLSYVSRNHPLISTLAEYLFDNALNPGGNRNIAARCSVVRSDTVEKITTFLLLRLRFLIRKQSIKDSLLAEECIITGLNGYIGSYEYIATKEAEQQFNSIFPTENVSDNDKKHWLNKVLDNFNKIDSHIEQIAENKAEDLLKYFEKMRKATKEKKKVEIEPLLPVDVLAISIILPKPKI